MLKLAKIIRWKLLRPWLVFSFLALILPLDHAAGKKPMLEEAQFAIYSAGQEVGQEKFSIRDSGDVISSNSVVNFQNPGFRHQRVRIETQLEMNSQYLPQNYRVLTDIGGQKTKVIGTFVPGQANFEYDGMGDSRKRGLLVGDRFIVLDANVFHHFIFIARLFDFNAGKRQSIEVVIPQALDEGILKISNLGIEKIQLRGKNRELHHLRADSGTMQIDLWVDDQRILHKIALPAKEIEIIRNH